MQLPFGQANTFCSRLKVFVLARARAQESKWSSSSSTIVPSSRLGNMGDPRDDLRNHCTAVAPLCSLGSVRTWRTLSLFSRPNAPANRSRSRPFAKPSATENCFTESRRCRRSRARHHFLHVSLAFRQPGFCGALWKATAWSHMPRTVKETRAFCSGFGISRTRRSSAVPSPAKFLVPFIFCSSSSFSSVALCFTSSQCKSHAYQVLLTGTYFATARRNMVM